MAHLLHQIATVRRLYENEASFTELASWYYVPPQLGPILREAQETGRDVKITVDEACNIHAVEILPPAPKS